MCYHLSSCILHTRNESHIVFLAAFWIHAVRYLRSQVAGVQYTIYPYVEGLTIRQFMIALIITADTLSPFIYHSIIPRAYQAS